MKESIKHSKPHVRSQENQDKENLIVWWFQFNSLHARNILDLPKKHYIN